MELTMYAKYLTSNERVIKTSELGIRKIILTNSRLIVLNGVDTHMKDIKYGHIVSIGWDYSNNPSLLTGSIICAALALFAFLFSQVENLSSIMIFATIALALVAVFFFMLFISSENGALSIVLTGGDIYKINLNGRGSKENMVSLCADIRDAEEQYLQQLVIDQPGDAS